MGFDIDCIPNIHSLPGEYFCPVCWTLVYPNEALQTQCGHIYCQPCLAYVSRTTQACLYDGYLVTEANSKALVDLNKSLAESIGEVVVHCLYNKSGCQWQGNLSEFIMHGPSCAYGNYLVVCNSCTRQIIHRQWQEHAQLCPAMQSQTQQESASAVATSTGTMHVASFTGPAASNHGQPVAPLTNTEQYQQQVLYEQNYQLHYPDTQKCQQQTQVTPAAVPHIAPDQGQDQAVAPLTQTNEQYPDTQKYQQQTKVTPAAVPHIAPDQGQVQAVAPLTQTNEQYQQKLQSEQYYKQQFLGYNYTQKYEHYGEYQQHTQMQVAVQNVAPQGQSAPYAQTQSMQLSQIPHMVPNQSQKQSHHPEVQAPVQHLNAQNQFMQSSSSHSQSQFVQSSCPPLPYQSQNQSDHPQVQAPLIQLQPQQNQMQHAAQHQSQKQSHHPEVQAPVQHLNAQNQLMQSSSSHTQFVQSSCPPLPYQSQNQSNHPQVQGPLIQLQPQQNQMQHAAQHQHRAYASCQQAHVPVHPSQALNDPWSETGWKMRSLQIRVFDIRNKAWLKLPLNYLRNVFRNCGVLDVRVEGSNTIGAMIFSTQQEAAATLDRFGGGFLPGHIKKQMVQLQWLDRPVAEGKKNASAEEGKQDLSCKRKNAPTNLDLLKRPRKNGRDSLVPFEEFTSERGRHVVEKFYFKAICVVSSLKPTNPRSSRTVCSHLGTHIIYGLYKFVTVKHSEGEAWGGEFDLEDLLVSYWGCCIDKVAGKICSSANVKLDENRILTLLSPFYMLEDGELPPYFDELEAEIARAPLDMDTNPEARLSHGKAVLSNAALRTTNELAHLAEDFFIAWDGSDFRDRSIIKSSPLAKSKGFDWRPITNADSLLHDIYRDARIDHHGDLVYKHKAFDIHDLDPPRYNDDIVSEALNHRHLIVHAPHRTQIQGRPIFEDPRELIYFIFHYYPSFFPRFIAFLLSIIKSHPVMERQCIGYFKK